MIMVEVIITIIVISLLLLLYDNWNTLWHTKSFRLAYFSFVLGVNLADIPLGIPGLKNNTDSDIIVSGGENWYVCVINLIVITQ